MENYGKKSGEEFQRELLKMAAESSKDASESAIAAMRGKTAGVVFSAGTAGFDAPGSEGSNARILMPDNISAGMEQNEIKRYENFYDQVFEKYFRGQKSDPIKQLVEFRDAKVRWADVNMIDGRLHIDKNGVDVVNTITRFAYMSIVRPDMSRDPQLSFNLWSVINGPVNDIVFIHNLPVNEKWAAVMLAAVLANLQFDFMKIGDRLGAAAAWKYRDLQMAIAEHYVINLVSDGKFDRTLNYLLDNVYPGKSLEDFAAMIISRNGFEPLDRALSKAVSDEAPKSREEVNFHRLLYLSMINLAMSSGFADDEAARLEAFKGLAIINNVIKNGKLW